MTEQRILKAGPRERRFLDALQDLFVGAKVDGQSGYINLMRIKAAYFQKVVEPALMADIAAGLKDFPEFREEFFDKLHSFFSRYFSRSGSICFAYTPQHMSVYEKVYTDEQDVVLFWKTHMLYYVKTDRIFRDLKVDMEGRTFFFDCADLRHKKANEKRELVFALDKVEQDGAIRLGVTYSERGRKTKTDEILKALKKAGTTGAGSAPRQGHAGLLAAKRGRLLHQQGRQGVPPRAVRPVDVPVRVQGRDALDRGPHPPAPGAQGYRPEAHRFHQPVRRRVGPRVEQAKVRARLVLRDHAGPHRGKTLRHRLDCRRDQARGHGRPSRRMAGTWVGHATISIPRAFCRAAARTASWPTVGGRCRWIPATSSLWRCGCSASSRIWTRRSTAG